MLSYCTQNVRVERGVCRPRGSVSHVNPFSIGACILNRSFQASYPGHNRSLIPPVPTRASRHIERIVRVPIITEDMHPRVSREVSMLPLQSSKRCHSRGRPWQQHTYKRTWTYLVCQRTSQNLKHLFPVYLLVFPTREITAALKRACSVAPKIVKRGMELPGDGLLVTAAVRWDHSL